MNCVAVVKIYLLKEFDSIFSVIHSDIRNVKHPLFETCLTRLLRTKATSIHSIVTLFVSAPL
jgi:hypothetical protein